MKFQAHFDYYWSHVWIHKKENVGGKKSDNKNYPSAVYIFLFLFTREKVIVFKIGGRTGELILKDSNVGFAVSLSSTLQELRVSAGKEMGKWPQGGFGEFPPC